LLKKLETNKNPFYGPVDAGRKAHWVKPELVAQVRFTEWTHETKEDGIKLRAPVFLGLREDKDPKECTFEEQVVGGYRIVGSKTHQPATIHYPLFDIFHRHQQAVIPAIRLNGARNQSHTRGAKFGIFCG